jgi:hypothetical protein
VFLVHVIEVDPKKGRVDLNPHFITIPTESLKAFCRQYKDQAERIAFYIWVDPIKRIAFDFRNRKGVGDAPLTEFLDESGFRLIADSL